MLKEFLQDIWQLMQINDTEKYKDYLSFILTISTTTLSIGVSVFTLTTAFIVNKRDALKEIRDNVQNGGISLRLAKQIKNAQTFLKKMKGITTKSIWIMSISLLILLSVSILKVFPENNYIHILFIGIIIIFYILITCLIQLCRWHLNHK